MQFEWDKEKEKQNFLKHGISFSEAEEIFSDEQGIKLKDIKHSEKEDRYFWVGKASDGRVLTTWFVERDDKIRIIGCAEWRKMRKLYENAKIERS